MFSSFSPMTRKWFLPLDALKNIDAITPFHDQKPKKNVNSYGKKQKQKQIQINNIGTGF